VLRWALVLGCAAVSPGCLAVAAVGAGAGAAGAVAWTQRGASSLAQGSVDAVFHRSEDVFRDMGIARTGDAMRDSGAHRSLTGRSGDLEITVEVERASSTTSNVEVYARRNEVQYDKGFARDVLSRIVATR
jgi:hypothetical protein